MNFLDVLFTVLYDSWNENYVLSSKFPVACGAVYYAAQDDFNFWVYRRNPVAIQMKARLRKEKKLMADIDKLVEYLNDKKSFRRDTNWSLLCLWNFHPSTRGFKALL